MSDTEEMTQTQETQSSEATEVSEISAAPAPTSTPTLKPSSPKRTPKLKPDFFERVGENIQSYDSSYTNLTGNPVHDAGVAMKNLMLLLALLIEMLLEPFGKKKKINSESESDTPDTPMGLLLSILGKLFQSLFNPKPKPTAEAEAEAEAEPTKEKNQEESPDATPSNENSDQLGRFSELMSTPPSAAAAIQPQTGAPILNAQAGFNAAQSGVRNVTDNQTAPEPQVSSTPRPVLSR